MNISLKIYTHRHTGLRIEVEESCVRLLLIVQVYLFMSLFSLVVVIFSLPFFSLSFYFLWILSLVRWCLVVQWLMFCHRSSQIVFIFFVVLCIRILGWLAFLLLLHTIFWCGFHLNSSYLILIVYRIWRHFYSFHIFVVLVRSSWFSILGCVHSVRWQFYLRFLLFHWMLSF